MKKLYYLFVCIGKIITIWTIMLIVSISGVSIVSKGKVNYGDRCNQSFNDEFIKNYEYTGNELNSSVLACNTYYLEYTTVLSEEENVLFLTSLAKLFYDNYINANIHIILRSKEYQILSTIVEYQVNYTITLI